MHSTKLTQLWDSKEFFFIGTHITFPTNTYIESSQYFFSDIDLILNIYISEKESAWKHDLFDKLNEEEEEKPSSTTKN